MDERRTGTGTGHPLVKSPSGRDWGTFKGLVVKETGGSILGSAVEVEGNRNISERFKKQKL